ncbi:hypothetical protein P152DRAFT_476880 [Eremomyces bilateralis CBS 781.70]|uniref:Nudix hydrolase domain-containing protein n=1 Tax=Eremomyces bilateralis CBS 781.70 TaxID=1392243 RepID=A0A6G1FTD0_9PEZI|nr:uncharacterized protein P152DRAFT_476880 [Eremomyces bilateralis CBS 781.70]KAF1808942.1 hypothetical protein P152DRAFT_476880 [Eremomyces bilateralis CBS 781.70]
MATLSSASAQAIARMRAYIPPPTPYYSLPLSRRAAVLILLFADKRGDLRVVLTIRSKHLNSYAGEAAFPGGKADSTSETAFQIARREAYEEIGLPLLDTELPWPYTIEHLCQMPTNLARTELGVRPCIAFLSASRLSKDTSRRIPTAEEALIPHLDPKEVAAVFTASFHNFLRATEEHVAAPAGSAPGAEAAGFPAEWYRGEWTGWHESQWRMHNFFVPRAGQSVAWARQLEEASTEAAKDLGTSTKDQPKPTRTMPTSSTLRQTDPKNDPTYPVRIKDAPPDRFRVFGMTARICVDAARLAYGEEPEFEHNSHFGDEDMIQRLMKIGRLGPIRKKGDQITQEVMIAASKI